MSFQSYLPHHVEPSHTLSNQSTEVLVDSLRSALGTNVKESTQFLGGTENGDNFILWSSAYQYKPLPTVYRPDEPKSQGKHLNSRSGIFPRLNGSVEETKTKLAPVHTELSAALHSMDSEGSGFLDTEAVHASLHKTGVFLSQADIDTLLQTVPRNPSGHLDFTALLDGIIGKSGAPLSARPPVQREFSWPDGESVIVGLSLHATAQPYAIPCEAMQRYAKVASDIRKREHDAEKIHDLLRNFLLNDLIVSPGKPGYPDLAFRHWLMHNGVLVRSETDMPGVVPPEVYEIFDQIITALGVPAVISATYTPTQLGSSLKRSNVKT